MPATTRSKAHLQAQARPDWAPLWWIAGVALVFLGLQLNCLVSKARGRPACCAHVQTASCALGNRHACIFVVSNNLLPHAEYGLRWSPPATFHDM